MICLKRKYAKNIKAKRIKMLLNMVARCGSYMIYLEDDSPHQIVMIMCEFFLFSHISNRHNMRNLCKLVMFSHTTCKNSLLCYFGTCASTM